MWNLITDFTQTLRGVSSLPALQDLLDAVTRDLGYDYFALLEHVDLTERSSGKILALSTYPASWVETYVAEGMVSRDPILLASHQTNIGFEWDRVGDFIDVRASHRLIRERTRQAGILSGFTVPAHIPGRFHGSCNFASRHDRDQPRENRHAAQLIGGFAFEAGRRMLQGSDPAPVPTKLTSRMLDCAVLAALGKTDAQAAAMLGIAEDTVTEYLDEARRRFDVVNRIQLLMHILFAGQLAISDVVR